MKRYLSVIVRTVAAAAALWLVKYLNPLVVRQLGAFDDPRGVTAVMLAAGAFVALAQLAKAVVSLRAGAEGASPALELLHRDGLIKGSMALWRTRIAERVRAFVQYAVWGGIIVFFSFQFASVGTLDDWTETVLFTPYFRQLHTSAMDTLPPPPVVRLSLVTDDNNTETYYRDLALIARHLSDAGAKAVVAGQPLSVIAYNQRVGNLDRLRDRQNETGRERIDDELGLPDSFGSVIMAYEPGVNTPYQLFGKDSTVIVNSCRTHGLKRLTGRDAEFSRMVGWFPVSRTPVNRRQYTEVDVALAAAKRFFGLPDSLQPERKDGAVMLGDLRIPVQPNGRAFADRQLHQGQWLPLIAHHGRAASAYDSGSEDSLHYWSDVTFQWATIKTPYGRLHNDLKEFRSMFDGKVVVVNWFNLSELSDEYPFGGIDLTNVIGSVLTGRFYERMPLMWGAVLILSVVLVALAVHFTKAMVSFWLSWLWSAVVSAFGIWTFLAHHRMFEFLYIDAAVLLSFLIFTLVKMSRTQNG